MNFGEFRTLRIGSRDLKKLVRASDGAVLFDAAVSPIPETATLTTFDFSDVVPTTAAQNRVECFAQGRRGSLAVSGDDWIFRTTSGTQFGGIAKITRFPDIQVSLDYYPQTTYRNQTIFLQGTTSISTGTLDPFQIQDQTVRYDFEDAQGLYYAAVDVTWGRIQSSDQTIRLDSNPYLTINEDFVGYTGHDGFPSDPAYDFNRHRGEEFRIFDSSNTRSLQFVVR